MPERVGFDRELKRAWLDQTVEIVLSTQEPEAVRAALRRALSAEITSDESQAKVIKIGRAHV